MSLINVETLIAAAHPIRPIKRLCDKTLRRVSERLEEISAKDRASLIPLETQFKGKVLQAFHTVRS